MLIFKFLCKGVGFKSGREGGEPGWWGGGGGGGGCLQPLDDPAIPYGNLKLIIQCNFIF